MESVKAEENSDDIKDSDEYTIEENSPTESYIDFTEGVANSGKEGDDHKEEVYAYIDTVNNTIVIQNSILEYGDKLKLMNEDGSEIYVIVAENNSSDETGIISDGDMVLQTMNNSEEICINSDNTLSEVIPDNPQKDDILTEKNNLTIIQEENESKDLSENFDTSQSTIWVNNASNPENNPELVFIPAQSIVSSSQILTAEESKQRKLLLTHISQESFNSDIADSPLLAESADNSRSETDGSVIVKKDISELETSPLGEKNNQDESTPCGTEDTECDISSETSNVVDAVPQFATYSNVRTIDNAVSVIHSPSTYSLSSSTFTSVKIRDSELQRKAYDHSEDFTTNDSYPSDQAFCLDSDNKLSIDEDSNTTSSQTSGLDLSKDSKIPYSVSLQEDYFSENELKIVSDSPGIAVDNLGENRVFGDLEAEINENSNVSINDTSNQLPSNVITDNFKNTSEFQENMFLKSDSLTGEEEKECVTGEVAEYDEETIEKDKLSVNDLNNLEEAPRNIEIESRCDKDLSYYEESSRHEDESSICNEASRQDDEIAVLDDEESKKEAQVYRQKEEIPKQDAEITGQDDEVSKEFHEISRQNDELPRPDFETLSQTDKTCDLDVESSKNEQDFYSHDEKELTNGETLSSNTDISPNNNEDHKNKKGKSKNNEVYKHMFGSSPLDKETSKIKVSSDYGEGPSNQASGELFASSVSTESQNPANDAIDGMDIDYSNDSLSPNYDIRVLRSAQSNNKIDASIVLKDSSNKNSDSSCVNRPYMPVIPKKRFKSQPDIEKEIAKICESGNSNSDIINKIEEHSRALQQNNTDCYNFTEEQNEIGNKSDISFHNILNDNASISKPNGFNESSCNALKSKFSTDINNSKANNTSKIANIIQNDEEVSNQKQSDDMEHNFNNIDDIFDLSPGEISKPEPPRRTYSSRYRKRIPTPELEDISETNNLVQSSVSDNYISDNNIISEDKAMEEEKTPDPGENYLSTGTIKVSANYTRKRKSVPSVVRELRTRNLRPRISIGNESTESNTKDDINKDLADINNLSSKEELNWGNYLLQTSFQSPCDSKPSDEKSPNKSLKVLSQFPKNKRMKSTPVSKSEAQWEKFVKSSSPKKTKGSTKKLREKVKNKVKKLCDSQEFNSQYARQHSSEFSTQTNNKRGRKRKISNTTDNTDEQSVAVKKQKTNSITPKETAVIDIIKKPIVTPKRTIPDDSESVFICPHCDFFTRRVNNLIVHVKYCSHKEESIKFLDYSVNDMERRQRIRGETEIDSKEKNKNFISNGSLDRDINEPSCSSASFEQPLDESDEDEAILEKNGFKEKSVVYAKKDGRYFPAVIWCFSASNVCVFLIKSATTFEKLKVNIDHLHKFDDPKWTSELLENAKSYPDSDDFLKAVQKCQSYSNKVCLSGGNSRINMRQFFKIPEDESFSDNEEGEDSIIEEHIYLDTETSSEEDTVTDLKPKKVADYILKGNLDEHVLSIFKEETPNEDHSNFDQSSRPKRRVDYNYGPFFKDENMTKIYEHLDILFNKKIGKRTFKVPYIYKVWIPAVLIKALSVVKNISLDDAKTMYYSIQVNSNAEERERYLLGK